MTNADFASQLGRDTGDIIERAEAALEGVSEGAWVATHRADLDWLSESSMVDSHDHESGSSLRVTGASDPIWGSLWPHRNARRDAEFIAAARELVPELVAELKVARAQLATLQDYPRGVTRVCVVKKSGANGAMETEHWADSWRLVFQDHGRTLKLLGKGSGYRAEVAHDAALARDLEASDD